MFVAPIAPLPEGNGLSMRAAMTLQGLARECNLTTAVLPVSDPGISKARLQWSAEQSEICELIPLSEPQEAARRWMKKSESRSLITLLQPLPERARMAPPDAVEGWLGSADFDAVWIMRLYLAATVLPFRNRSAKLILDIDEDDAAVLRATSNLQEKRGDLIAAETLRDEADAYDRFAEQAFGWFDQIVTASPRETEIQRRRYPSVKAATIPNAIRLPRVEQFAQREMHPPKLLFIGNFDYAPNFDAADRLAERIFPIILQSEPEAELHLAGKGEKVQQFGRKQNVIVHGFAPDLAQLYDQATVALVPLQVGGGSRLKILEAFAYALPVVATAKGCEGLEVCDDTQLLIAESDTDLAAAALRLSSDENLTNRLVGEARRFVVEQHDVDVTGRKIAELIL